MGLYLKRPIVFFDLETTGTDVNADRIVEFAAKKVHVDRTTETYHKRFNPQIPIPASATEIHGIADADVADCPTFRDNPGAPTIFPFVAHCDLAGYNITRFDLPLLYNEMMRCGGYQLDLDMAIVDCCQIFHQREARDLEAAVKFYTGEEHKDAHAALADVEATMRVFSGQLKMYEDLPDTVDKIWEQTKDPDAIDLAGKLKWQDGDVVLTFGKNKGKPLQNLDSGYFTWMLKNKVVGPDAEHIIRDAAKGYFPKK